MGRPAQSASVHTCSGAGGRQSTLLWSGGEDSEEGEVEKRGGGKRRYHMRCEVWSMLVTCEVGILVTCEVGMGCASDVGEVGILVTCERWGY